MRLLAFSVLGLIALLFDGGPVFADGINGRDRVNALEKPWNAVGRINRSGKGHCTGFLVADQVLLTAAHCLWNARLQRWFVADDLHYVAGYQQSEWVFHTRVDEARPAPAFDYENREDPLRRSAADWALLRLRDRVSDDVARLSIATGNAAWLKGHIQRKTSLLIPGYGRGRQHIMSVPQDCHLLGFDETVRLLAHNCVTQKGDSGSPVMLRDQDGNLVVIGIHVANAEQSDGSWLGLTVPVFGGQLPDGSPAP